MRKSIVDYQIEMYDKYGYILGDDGKEHKEVDWTLKDDKRIKIVGGK